MYLVIYKWFGKPGEGIKGKHGEGGVGFLVSELLLHDGTIIKYVKCNETIWLRIKIRTSGDLYIGYVHVYMPTQVSVKQVSTDRLNLIEEDICMFQLKGRVVLLG